MEFLIIVSALLLHRVIPDLGWLHKDRWYASWISRLSYLDMPMLSFLVSLLAPLLAVLVVVWVLNYHWQGVPLFVFGLLGLLYALGRGDLDAKFDTLEQDFARDDVQAAYHDAEAFSVGHSESDAETGNEFHLDLLESVSYRFFEHYFPVIFWFAVLGVPGALLYRLSWLHLDLQDKDDKSRDIQSRDIQSQDLQLRDIARRWLWLIEWIPTRLLGLSFALVGNFASCIHRWHEYLFGPEQSTRQILRHYVIGALSADTEAAGADISVAELEMIRNLFYRALTLWVCVIALLIVF